MQELLDSHEVQTTSHGTDWAGIGSGEGSACVTGGEQTKTGSSTAEIGIQVHVPTPSRSVHSQVTPRTVNRCNYYIFIINKFKIELCTILNRGTNKATIQKPWYPV